LVGLFAHRQEYVYLPPAWFTPQRPQLPVVMMISGEFNTPADWIRVGGAVRSADDYAARHQGTAPILVFVDTGGTFNNDTECVNGPRGHVADHLVQDLPPYIESTFHSATTPDHWATVGWSAGGTCAVDLALMHPELLGTFEDIAGDLGPSVGDHATTVAKLFGGNDDAWAAFDPLTVLTRHGPYSGTAGWFVNSIDNPPPIGGQAVGTRPPGRHDPGRSGGPRDQDGISGFGGRQDGRDAPGVVQGAARQLCAAATSRQVSCTLHVVDGRHSWQFATTAFRDALPWLSARLGLSAPPNPT
jgi:S-formylglutathione hydrolase FrmB